MSVQPPVMPPYVRVTEHDQIVDALAALQVSVDRPVLVVVGGAGGMDERDRDRVESLLREWLIPVMDDGRAAVVDGGTDAGVMSLLGRIRTQLGATFPLVGVAAEKTVRIPGQDAGDAADLEAGHTGVLLVPGSMWGDESPWIAQVADSLAASCSSATLVINGGEITYKDIAHSLNANRPVLILEGTGRTADVIAEAMTERADFFPVGSSSGPADAVTDRSSDDRLNLITTSPLVTVVHLNDPAGVAAAVVSAMSLPGASVAGPLRSPDG